VSTLVEFGEIIEARDEHGHGRHVLKTHSGCLQDVAYIGERSALPSELDRPACNPSLSTIPTAMTRLLPARRPDNDHLP
jgi:hypothetical protein